MGELFQRLDSFMKDHAPPGASVDMEDGASLIKNVHVLARSCRFTVLKAAAPGLS